ncbi:glycosyltransferase family 2 protein [Streptomyces sp. NPDC048604]|uniref:glycosyltransferase family 2 protein n=1 Tax=Streptomyces sp. NPDC048604 TaxID=3365578 RepID=UPI003714C044
MPSRRPVDQRNEAKRTVQDAVTEALPKPHSTAPEIPLVVAGDLNIIECGHLRALRSVARQTYQHFEIIAVRDGGHAVEPVIALWQRAMPVRLLESDNPRDVSCARNRTIGVTQGGYIALLDDDDVFWPHHLHAAVDALRSRWADTVYGQALVSATWTERPSSLSRQGAAPLRGLGLRPRPAAGRTPARKRRSRQGQPQNVRATTQSICGGSCTSAAHPADPRRGCATHEPFIGLEYWAPQVATSVGACELVGVWRI